MLIGSRLCQPGALTPRPIHPLLSTPVNCRKSLSRPSWNRRRKAISVSALSEKSAKSKEGADASEIVRKFYQGVNGHDLPSVEDLIAQNCVYEDLIFPRPFVGRQAVLGLFKKFNDSIGTDLQFVIDDISAEDSLVVGVTWHLEWKGKAFPFTRGCSFYRLQVINGTKQIVYGRDCVEPAIKPGEAALSIVRGVVWLLERFPQLQDQL